MQFHSMPPNIMALLMDFPFLSFSICECKWRAVSCTLELCVRNIKPGLAVGVIFKQAASLCQGSKVNLQVL